MKAHGETDVIPSSSLLREYVSLERCEAPQRSNSTPQRLTLFSDKPHHKGLDHLPLSDSFKAETGAFTTTIRGTTHNWIGGSRTAILTTKVSTTTKASRVQRPKSNKFTNFQLPRILVESTNRCTMQWQEHTKCSSSSLSNSNKATNAYGGIREEEQRGDAPRTPKSRSTGVPSLRGEIDR